MWCVCVRAWAGMQAEAALFFSVPSRTRADFSDELTHIGAAVEACEQRSQKERTREVEAPPRPSLFRTTRLGKHYQNPPRKIKLICSMEKNQMSSTEVFLNTARRQVPPPTHWIRLQDVNTDTNSSFMPIS